MFKKIVSRIMLALTLLLMLMAQASAVSSITFVAPYRFAGKYLCHSGHGLAGVDKNAGTGRAATDAVTTSPSELITAGIWVSNGSLPITPKPTQAGQVTAVVRLDDGGIWGKGFVEVKLFVYESRPAGMFWLTYLLATKKWTRSIAGPFDKVIASVSVNLTWNQNYRYCSEVWVTANGWGDGASRASIGVVRFLHIVWSFLQSSPPTEPTNPGDPEIWLNAPEGDVGTSLTVNGTSFASSSMVYIYYDDVLQNKTLSDAYGNFTCPFTVPSSSVGSHVIKAIDQLENMATTIFLVKKPKQPVLGDINDDGKVDIQDLVLVIKNFGGVVGTHQERSSSTYLPLIAIIPLICTVVYFARKKPKLKT